MKSILIDVKNKRVIEKILPDDYSLQDIYDAIDCSIFECIRIDDINSLYIDENGLFKKDYTNAFIFGDIGPIINSALILGTDAEGESIDTTLDVDDIIAKVNFLEPQDLEWIYKAFRGE